ncbi:MAG: copper amine oxidase N-terminal domain-containing protein [Clostridia bacterium]
MHKMIFKNLSKLTVTALITSALLVNPLFATEQLATTSLLPLGVAGTSISSDKMTDSSLVIQGALSLVGKDSIQIGDNQTGIVFHLTDKTVILNAAGVKIDAKTLNSNMYAAMVYPTNAKLTKSLPAQTSDGQLLIIKTPIAYAQIMQFDTTLLSTDKNLKLNLSASTVIISEKGEKLAAKDIPNKNVLVISTIQTLSIPAQTNPEVLIIFTENHQATEYMHYNKNQHVMIPIREIAQTFGFNLKWDGHSKKVTLTKGTVTITINTGSNKMKFQQSLHQMDNASEITKGNLYVASSLIAKIQTLLNK